MAALLSAVEAGRASLVGSAFLDFESDQNPDPARARRVRTLLLGAGTRISLTAGVVARARELEGLGLRGLDALHVAAAGRGADLLVTTDERMIRSARRAGRRLAVRVVRPAEALASLGESSAP